MHRPAVTNIRDVGAGLKEESEGILIGGPSAAEEAAEVGGCVLGEAEGEGALDEEVPAEDGERGRLEEMEEGEGSREGVEGDIGGDEEGGERRREEAGLSKELAV